MNKHSSIEKSGSLLERAAERYGFARDMRDHPNLRMSGEAATSGDLPPAAPAYNADWLHDEPVAPATPANRRHIALDRDRLRQGNFIVPEDPVSGLAEEFRIIKRQLLLAARGGKGYEAVPNGERILVCSANPEEGKTFCAVNLAFSIASEKDNRVLLVDADFAKADVPRVLGFEAGQGLTDALADPSLDIEELIVDTDVDGLSILTTGAAHRDDTELLASHRTERLLDRLTASDPQRIVIFDSPPALAASPASVLALNVGQVLLVVRADETGESELTEAVRLLSGCEHIQLLLNSTRFSPMGSRFGAYYSQGARS